MKILRLLLMFMLTALVFGCSGSDTSYIPLPSTATLVVTTSGTLTAGNSLAGVGLTFILPTGVTPPLDATGQVDGSKLVTASGVTVAGGLVVTAVHVEGQPAKLSVVVASKAASGFGVGETMLLTLNLASGIPPKASDFTITDFQAADLNGKAVSTVNAALAMR